MEKPKEKSAFAAGAENWNQDGLTDREYYAAKFMAALLTNPEHFKLYNDSEFAWKAVHFADLLMKELNKPKY